MAENWSHSRLFQSIPLWFISCQPTGSDPLWYFR